MLTYHFLSQVTYTQIINLILKDTLDTHKADSCVRGFHVYSDIWTPFVRESLTCEHLMQTLSGNPNDPYAVAIRKGSKVVGHMPRKSSAVCSLFLLLGALNRCVRIVLSSRYLF